jgi:hypothetical protein
VCDWKGADWHTLASEQPPNVVWKCVKKNCFCAKNKAKRSHIRAGNVTWWIIEASICQPPHLVSPFGGDELDDVCLGSPLG